MARGVFDPNNYEGTDRIQHIENYLALGYQQQSATLTLNRAGGFVAEQVFDLGQGIASVLITATLTARVADGETFGLSAGNIFIPTPVPTISPDNVHFTADVTNWAVYTAGAASIFATNDSVTSSVLSGRYLKVSSELDISGGAAPYDGANNPTASVALTVTYV